MLSLCRANKWLARRTEELTRNETVSASKQILSATLNIRCVPLLQKAVTADEVNAALKEAAAGPMRRIIEFCEDPIVSSDIIGNPHSSIIDSLSTMTMPPGGGTMVKVVSWYDNEWGYSCRTADLALKLASL